MRFPRLSIVYIGALAAIALSLGAFALGRTSVPSPDRLALAVVFAALMALAILFPIHWDLKTKLVLDYAVISASVLLFEPGIAMLLTGLGMFLAQAIRRQPWDQTVFNVSQTMLQAGVGGLLLQSAGWNFREMPLAWAGAVPLILTVAAVMYLINALSLSVVVGLESGLPLLAVARELGRFDLLGLAAQLALGVVAAVIAAVQPWVLPLLLPPALAIYRSTERHVRLHEQTRELAHQAFHDSLTGLPNRVLLLDRLEHALDRAGRYRNRNAVLFLDLDGFKIVNDSLGHQVGDQLLVAVAERLRVYSRPEDTIARLGGDEFAFLLEDIADQSDVARIAQRLTDALRAPFTVSGREVYVTASVGIVVSEPGEDDAARLLRDADVAMYRAKAKGKARYEVFDARMGADALRRLEAEEELRGAIERQELRVYYQPRVELASGDIVGMEALVRWDHPRRGLLSPSEFIPLAEETGMILPIGRWVLAEACSQARAWQDRYPGPPGLLMSVNLSVRQFQHPELVEEIEQILRETGLAAGSLKLEITESVVMEDADANIVTLRKLDALGVRLEIDDFGTGYSSLGYLKRFPVDVLKIDRSFVAGLGRDPEDTAIVRAVISLAHTLGLAVTAEGIETAEQLVHLREMGCELGQGYFFSQPLPSAAVGGLLIDARVDTDLAPY